MSDVAAPTVVNVPPPAAEGWHWPRGCRVAHYLRGGVSLCGRWVCHPSVIQAVRPALPTDCAACRVELARTQGRTPAA